MIRKTPTGRAGFVLMPVILALALLSLVAVLLLERSGSAVAVPRQSASLDYAAESGFRHAGALLKLAGCLSPGTVPATALGAFEYSATMAPTGATLTPTVYAIPASADTWIDANGDEDNYGNDNEVKSLRKSGDHRRPLLSFDLSAVPAHFDVASAELVLYVRSKDDTGFPVEVFRVTDPWLEMYATWGNAAGDYDATVLQASFLPLNDGPLNIDLTALARQWIRGKAANDGVLLISTSFEQESRYASRQDGDPAKRPTLIVSGRPDHRYAVTATAADADGTSRLVTGTQDGMPASALFLDDFDAGYGGNEGTHAFAGDWQEETEGDGPGSGGLAVVSDAYCALGNCLKLEPSTLLGNVRISRAVNLDGASSAVLSLHTRRRNANWTLEISANGGSSWQTLKSAGAAHDSRQVRDSFDISAHATADTRLRLKSTVLTSLGTKYVAVDDVQIDVSCVP